MAAEQAKAEGHKVEVVVVAEDVAIEEPGLAGRRGLAGVALVHKVRAGLSAECGHVAVSGVEEVWTCGGESGGRRWAGSRQSLAGV